MAENKPSWIDYVNLGLTAAIGALGIFIALYVARSADRLSENSLIVASATFLLDESPIRQQGGVQIVCWLNQNNIALPDWEQRLIQQVAAKSNAPGPLLDESGDAPIRASAPCGSVETSAATGAVGAAAGAAAGSSVAAEASPPPGSGIAAPRNAAAVANQLVAAVGGTLPRLFIQYPDVDQRPGAEALRVAVAQTKLNGQPIIVPKIDPVTRAPDHLELRYFKRADRDEAGALAVIISGILGSTLGLNDRSATNDARQDVKPRTYELWFPHDWPINLPAAVR
jgi:hypothetical protein